MAPHAHPASSRLDTLDDNRAAKSRQTFWDRLSAMQPVVVLKGLSASHIAKASDVYCPQVRRSVNQKFGVSHLDVVSCWKGLSYAQAAELALWEELFKRNVEKQVAIHLSTEFEDQLRSQGSKQMEKLTNIFDSLYEFAYRLHTRFVPINLTDLVSDMMADFYNNGSNLQHTWFISSRNLPKVVCNFVRTRDCFKDQYPQPDLEIHFTYVSDSRTGLTVYGQVAWFPPYLTLVNVPTQLSPGKEYRIVPEYHAPYLSPHFALFEHNLTYRIDSSPLDLSWCSRLQGFRALVPAGQTAVSTPVGSRLIRSILSATIAMHFTSGVRFQQVTRYCLKLEIFVPHQASTFGSAHVLHPNGDLNILLTGSPSPSEETISVRLSPESEREASGRARFSSWQPSYSNTPPSKRGTEAPHSPSPSLYAEADAGAPWHELYHETQETTSLCKRKASEQVPTISQHNVRTRANPPTQHELLAKRLCIHEPRDSVMDIDLENLGPGFADAGSAKDSPTEINLKYCGSASPGAGSAIDSTTDINIKKIGSGSPGASTAIVSKGKSLTKAKDVHQPSRHQPPPLKITKPGLPRTRHRPLPLELTREFVLGLWGASVQAASIKKLAHERSEATHNKMRWIETEGYRPFAGPRAIHRSLTPERENVKEPRIMEAAHESSEATHSKMRCIETKGDSPFAGSRATHGSPEPERKKVQAYIDSHSASGANWSPPSAFEDHKRTEPDPNMKLRRDSIMEDEEEAEPKRFSPDTTASDHASIQDNHSQFLADLEMKGRRDSILEKETEEEERKRLSRETAEGLDQASIQDNYRRFWAEKYEGARFDKGSSHADVDDDAKAFEEVFLEDSEDGEMDWETQSDYKVEWRGEQSHCPHGSREYAF